MPWDKGEGDRPLTGCHVEIKPSIASLALHLAFVGGSNRLTLGERGYCPGAGSAAELQESERRR